MKTRYSAPQLFVELIEVEHGIATSLTDPSEFDLVIGGFGEEQEW